MRVAHVNNIDLVGSRFNGYDMLPLLAASGIHSHQFVLEKLSDNKHVTSLLRPFEEPFLREACAALERKVSLQAMIYPYGWRLMRCREFRRADITHYHLIHNQLLSLASLPRLASSKPSVLTLHDPWLLSGHCFYPLDCGAWQSGCLACPRPDLPFALDSSGAARMWRLKRAIFKNIKLDIVVASKFMLSMAERSPILENIPDIHVIPFGIDVQAFGNLTREQARARLGIPQDRFALFFRADYSPFKGMDTILAMLPLLKSRLPADKLPLVLTVGETGVTALKHYGGLVEYGWLNDPQRLSWLYAACDVFLMPSRAEAFGLMAIEAMAAKRPVIVAEGTSLPEVTFAPECGVVIAQRDPEALAAAVLRLMNSPEECLARGSLGHNLAGSHYAMERYVDDHIALYGEILKRRKIE